MNYSSCLYAVITGLTLMGVSSLALPSRAETSWTTRNATPLIAYNVVTDAYNTCARELSQYGVRVTGLENSYSGKGGATVIVRGVNAGGYPVRAECTLTIPSRQLDVRYL